GAVAAGLALAAAEQADLLVVADRARGGAEPLRHLADAQRGGGRHAATASASRSFAVVGRSSDTNAPTTDVAASTHSAVCMLWMNGSSRADDSPVVTPEKIASRTDFGTAAVTIAITNA